MKKIISKEELEEVREVEGELRGAALKGDGQFVVKKRNNKGLKELEEKMKEFGFPVEYEKIKSLAFYPLSLDALNLLLIKRLFNLKEEEIVELGEFLSKSSLVLKLFMNYFVSLEKVMSKAPEMWHRNYTVGELEVAEFNKSEGRAVVKIKDFNIHPLYCLVFKGYFKSVLDMLTKSEVSCQETKCIHNGDSFHEFLLTW